MKDLAWIKWTDSYNPTDNTWQDYPLDKKTHLYCYSVGWIADENDDILTLAGSISCGKASGAVNQVHGLMSVPKVAIVERRNFTLRHLGTDRAAELVVQAPQELGC